MNRSMHKIPVKSRKSQDTIPECYTTDTENFPKEGIGLLQSLDLMGLNIPTEFGGRGLGGNYGNVELLQTLKKIGAYDLSLGRVYEGHLNALALIGKFGTLAQRETYFLEAFSGKLFGIWNSELPSERLMFKSSGDRFLLEGAKVFCSGASHVHRPIVTAEGTEGSQMLILHLDEYDLHEDFRYWRPLGMKASVSCRFDFTGLRFPEEQLLGGTSDYEGEPDFTGGAVRFAAVQLGGAEAAIRATLRHLKKMGRSQAPEQARRLGQLAILRESGNLWLKGAAKAMDAREENPSGCMHYANMFRTVARDICEEVLKLCEMSVGLQGMMQPHPLERIHRDLSVYLKQPGPDRALSAVGQAFAEAYPEK